MKLLSVAAFAVALVYSPLSATAQSAEERIEWNRPVQPFNVAGNVNYVGVEGVSAYLITTPQGHILIDGGLPESAPLILASIRKLGFDPADVKLLLNSHAHFDHAGGLAALKAATGAQIVASEGDKPALESGRHIGLANYEGRFPAITVDRVVRDGDTVELGGTVLTARVTPGHTAGCTSWSVPVEQQDKTLTVLFFCSASVAGATLVDNTEYPQIVSDFRSTFDRLDRIQVDILLANHPGLVDLFERRRRQQAGDAAAFVDRGALPALSHELRAAFESNLARQEANR
ncbi:MAG: subclass B3 metallo-beta-lactamase [Brevundimonas sp.]|uniref:subclass B3 metallo-beta-lactamase n=1 Tax=Brevundimonas sp. TaxID=1871086 RepID=UPI002722CA91|nr:subclass B3 metallo-beta-lactamase [Brevundimonas sp.]MDO9607296.1 subclass B3 metallo-beta-lactamase [Brevundimonas sp.]